MLRFWCPPTEGKLWLDDVRLRPVQTRTIDVPIEPPIQAADWGNVHWKLSPHDARCKAIIVDAEKEKGSEVRKSLYSGDSLAPLAATVGGVRPLVLRLEVYPSVVEPVVLQEVEVRFTSSSGG